LPLPIRLPADKGLPICFSGHEGSLTSNKRLLYMQ